MLLAAGMQATPPPPPPPLTTPQPSPSASPPALSIAPAPVANLHPSQSLTLFIQNGTGPYTATVDTPIVTVAIDQTARTLTVTASQQTGRATLTVNDSTGASVQIPVQVAVDAGTAPSSITLRVTGAQLDTQWLTLLIQKDVQNAVTLQPGASVQVQPFTLPAALGPGAVATVPVQVQISGGDQFFNVTPTVTINLQNVEAAPFTPPVLMYDDDPEKLTATGVLFRGQVNPGSPARLYYYHENDDSGNARDLAVVVSTSAAQPSTVQLIDASAGPNMDVMTVGHAVSRDFLKQKTLNEGIVVDVDAQTPYVAEQFTMKRLDGAAGSIGIRVMSGGAVTVTVLAVPSNGLALAQLPAALAGPQLPDDGHHRTGMFSLVNYAEEPLTYTAPGPDADVQYGAQTPPAADVPGQTPGRDYGDYGVLRVIDFNITNPLDQPQTLYLYERPMGGAVRSSFLVSGTLVQVGCARVSNRYQIGDPIVVQPHANIQLPVETMTDGGSNYPLEVGITATPPQPVVPQINAPDGCFPKPQASPAASPMPSPAPEPTGR